MLAGDVMSLDRSTGEITREHVGEVAAVIRPRSAGGAILALKDRFAVSDGDLANLRTVAVLDQPETVRLNEGGCDPDGRFYCGSMAYDESPDAGTVWRLDPDGSVRVQIQSVTTSNGIEFSPDGTLAYFIDTARHAVDVFDYDPVTGLHDRRRFVDVPAEHGNPDGLTVDSEGGVWVALFDGHAVRRYAPGSAQNDGIVELPVKGVTAATFGGDDLDTLYITTSQIRADMQAQPESGTTYLARPGVTGLPARAFAG
jgi:sugar lactone lactonase YvrE